MPVQVAVGVIRNAKDEVLVARRHADSHQGGLWEFPGGKLEPGEDAVTALGRELREELDLELQTAHPLIRITHHYSDRSVLLDVWIASRFTGVPCGREGQPIRWVPVGELCESDFPAANTPIIQVLRLPREIAITPEVGDCDRLLAMLRSRIVAGVPAIQLRQKQLSGTDYADWFAAANALCQQHEVLLFANGCPELCRELDAAAVHLTSHWLMQSAQRPLPEDVLLSAACHNREQLERAEALGVDLAILSPVAPSAGSTSQSQTLGWPGFAALRERVCLPVYALGGLKRADLGIARQHGAHGIAAIRAFQQTAAAD